MAREDRNFGELMWASFALCRKAWALLVQIFAVFFIPFLLINKFLLENSTFIMSFSDKYSTDVFFVFDTVVSLAIFLFFILCVVAIVKATQSIDEGRAVSVWEAYEQALAAWWPYVRVKMLYALKVAAWSLLLIVPGVWAFFIYSFCGMACLVDGKKGMEALTYSKKLIAPRWIKCADYILFIFLLLYAIGAPLIITLDTGISIAANRGYFFWAQAGDILEMMILGAEGIFFLVFFYYFYREWQERLIVPVGPAVE